MNPEFLCEGSAVDDVLQPDKLVVGTTTDRLHAVFRPLIDEQNPSIVGNRPQDGRVITDATNAVLAAKSSPVNDLGNSCTEFELDAYEVMAAIGLDDRIAAQFRRSGVGWGGSCFLTAGAAIMAAARESGYDPAMLEAAAVINARQPDRLLIRLESHVDPADKRIAVRGLVVKPQTDDSRNSRESRSSRPARTGAPTSSPTTPSSRRTCTSSGDRGRRQRRRRPRGGRRRRRRHRLGRVLDPRRRIPCDGDASRRRRPPHHRTHGRSRLRGFDLVGWCPRPSAVLQIICDSERG